MTQRFPSFFLPLSGGGKEQASFFLFSSTFFGPRPLFFSGRQGPWALFLFFFPSFDDEIEVAQGFLFSLSFFPSTPLRGVSLGIGLLLLSFWSWMRGSRAPPLLLFFPSPTSSCRLFFLTRLRGALCAARRRLFSLFFSGARMGRRGLLSFSSVGGFLRIFFLPCLKKEGRFSFSFFSILWGNMNKTLSFLSFLSFFLGESTTFSLLDVGLYFFFSRKGDNGVGTKPPFFFFFFSFTQVFFGIFPSLPKKSVMIVFSLPPPMVDCRILDVLFLLLFLSTVYFPLSLFFSSRCRHPFLQGVQHISS